MLSKLFAKMKDALRGLAPEQGEPDEDDEARVRSMIVDRMIVSCPKSTDAVSCRSLDVWCRSNEAKDVKR